MLIDISLSVIFLSSASFLLRRISLKLPEIITVPEETIREQLRKDRDRSRIYLFIVHFRTLWQERYFHNLFFNSAGKVLQRLHILLLRLDNGVVHVLRKVRSGGAAQAHTNGEYWKMLREDERELPPQKPPEEKDEKKQDIQRVAALFFQPRVEQSVIRVVSEEIKTEHESKAAPYIAVVSSSFPKPRRARKIALKKPSMRGAHKKKKREIPPT